MAKSKAKPHLTRATVEIKIASSTGYSSTEKFGVNTPNNPKVVILGSIRELFRLATLDGYADEAQERAQEAVAAVREYLRTLGEAA